MSLHPGFVTTQWSVVLSAQAEDSTAAAALNQLIERYWYPLYAFVRRRGAQVEEAEDLTQGFFAKLVEKDYVKVVDQERGRFRTFLLAAFEHYCANERRAQRALKRGGGRVELSLDYAQAESRYSLEPHSDSTAEDLFERRWALTLLDRVLDRLEQQMTESGQQDRYTVLRPHLTAQAELSYREAADQLGLTEGAVKVAVHRMRRRFGELLRAEISDTVASEELVDEEIRGLFAALASSA